MKEEKSYILQRAVVTVSAVHTYNGAGRDLMLFAVYFRAEEQGKQRKKRRVRPKNDATGPLWEFLGSVFIVSALGVNLGDGVEGSCHA